MHVLGRIVNVLATLLDSSVSSCVSDAYCDGIGGVLDRYWECFGIQCIVFVFYMYSTLYWTCILRTHDVRIRS